MRSPDVVKEFRGVQRFDYLEPVRWKFDAKDSTLEAEHILQEAVARAIESGKSSFAVRQVPTRERLEGFGSFFVLAVYQGYLLSEPLPLQDFESFMRKCY